MPSHMIGLDRALTGATDEQRRVVDLIAAGPRGSVPSPFLAMLDAPHLAEAIQQVGIAIRYNSKLPADQREIAILATAGAASCGYEWQYHAPVARSVGVPQDAIEASRPGGDTSALAEPWRLIIDFCREIVDTRRASPERTESLISALGREGATELIAISGYYALLASFIIIGGHDTGF